MPVYHNLKTIFIRVPKTAGTTMCEKFHTLDSFARYFPSYQTPQIKPTAVTAIHESILDIKKNIPESYFNNYYKIGFVRNPWDWLVSYYSYFKNSDIKQTGVLVEGKFIFGEAVTEKLGNKIIKKREVCNLSFHDFLSLVENDAEEYESQHTLSQITHPYQPQYKYLMNESGELIADFIGKYENLKNDWQQLCKKINISTNRFTTLELGRHNESTHRDYRSYYEDRDIERVYKIYKKDIEFFDYRF